MNLIEIKENIFFRIYKLYINDVGGSRHKYHFLEM